MLDPGAQVTAQELLYGANAPPAEAPDGPSGTQPIRSSSPAGRSFEGAARPDPSGASEDAFSAVPQCPVGHLVSLASRLGRSERRVAWELPLNRDVVHNCGAISRDAEIDVRCGIDAAWRTR